MESEKEEMKKHLELWKKLNRQEKLDWIFAQLMYDLKTGKWVEKRDVLKEL
jgi:membrane-associated PAP2 superfamily phosphatase